MFYGPGLGMSDFLNRIDTIFLGRKSYDMMKDMPVNPDDPFTASLAHVRQYVFSNTLDVIPDQSSYQLINTDAIHWIRQYKESPGGDIWLFGGAGFTRSLFESKMIDELILAVHPVLLGGGKSFAQGLNKRVKLNFVGSTHYDTGLVMMRYTVD